LRQDFFRAVRSFDGAAFGAEDGTFSGTIASDVHFRCIAATAIGVGFSDVLHAEVPKCGAGDKSGEKNGPAMQNRRAV
jgi:hypothetical protein